jgi:CHC2 zinc finger
VSAVTKVLDRLIGAKQSGPGRWMAKCPAHEDRSPSFSIRETEDGRVLLHCFAGCANGDVLANLGLRMSDLFDKPLTHHLPPIRGGFSARELLELSSHEATVVALLASDAQIRTLTADELQRLVQAAARLGKVQELAHGR